MGLRAFRELDDALLRLRFDLPEIGIGHRAHAPATPAVVARDEALAKATTGFAREVRLLQRRVLKRFDNTARSFYAVADARGLVLRRRRCSSSRSAPIASTC